jgi:hypothetical protein
VQGQIYYFWALGYFFFLRIYRRYSKCSCLFYKGPSSNETKLPDTKSFFFSCKANARVKLAKTGPGPHSSTLFVIWVVRLLFVLFCVLFVCKCVLPLGDNPIAVNKYIKKQRQVAKLRDKIFRVVIICNCDDPDYDRVYCRPTNIRPRYSATDLLSLNDVNKMSR